MACLGLVGLTAATGPLPRLVQLYWLLAGLWRPFRAHTISKPLTPLTRAPETGLMYLNGIYRKGSFV